MWQYTTETIINSNEGNLFGGHRFDIIATDGTSRVYDASGTVKSTISGVQPEDMLLIDGVNSLKVQYIDKIYRSVYRPEVKATATISGIATASADAIYRLTVVLREEGSVRSTLQNAYLHKSKPFHYEVEVKSGDTAAVIVAKLEKIIKKEMAMTDFNYFKAAVSGNDLVLTADDCYIQFKDVKLEEVLPIEDPATPLAAKLLGANVTKSITGVTVAKTDGDQGAGTVTRLVKNLRIPTGASINPFAADHGGMPVPGGKYDQFLIEYVTDRHHVAGGVVGSVAEKSLTSHILFIESAILNDVVKVLTAIKAPVAAGRGIANPAVNNAPVADGTRSEDTLTKKTEMGSVE